MYVRVLRKLSKDGEGWLIKVASVNCNACLLYSWLTIITYSVCKDVKLSMTVSKVTVLVILHSSDVSLVIEWRRVCVCVDRFAHN